MYVGRVIVQSLIIPPIHNGNAEILLIAMQRFIECWTDFVQNQRPALSHQTMYAPSHFLLFDYHLMSSA